MSCTSRGLLAAATALAVATALAALSPTLVTAHSTMNRPEVTNNNECRLGGTVKAHYGTCHGPCGREYPAVTKTSPTDPAEVWARGSLQSYSYLRNGHKPSGFVRVTLVPLADKMEHGAHTRYAFLYGCWGAGVTVACTGSVADKKNVESNKWCGTDEAMFTHHFTVPAIYPDGDYIFGWVWYGGAGDPYENGTLTSFFTDYWQCSYVRIKGGAPLVPTATAQFVPGPTATTGDTCLSYISRPGIAGPEPVFGHPLTNRKPDVFADGRSPPVIQSAWMQGGINAGQAADKAGGDGGGKDQRGNPTGDAKGDFQRVPQSAAQSSGGPPGATAGSRGPTELAPDAAATAPGAGATPPPLPSHVAPWTTGVPVSVPITPGSDNRVNGGGADVHESNVPDGSQAWKIQQHRASEAEHERRRLYQTKSGWGGHLATAVRRWMRGEDGEPGVLVGQEVTAKTEEVWDRIL